MMFEDTTTNMLPYRDDTMVVGPPLVLEPRDGVNRLRGVGVLNCLNYARSEGGRDGLTRVLGLLSDEDRLRLEDVRRTDWYPFHLYCRLLRAIDEAFGNGDLSVVYDIGVHNAHRDMPSFFRPVLRIGKPGWILEVATRLWRWYHGEGYWELDRMPHFLVAKLLDFEDADEAHCMSFIAFVSTALELSGAQDVESAHIACKAKGAPHCVFTCRWS